MEIMPYQKNTNIPSFYIYIYNYYVNCFERESSNTIQILNQLLWYNSYIESNTETLFLNSWSKQGITQIKDIINPQGTFLTHKQLKDTYQINITFLTTLQIQSSIPNPWMKSLRKRDKIPKYIPAENTIPINNKIVTLDKVTCKDFYWHLIN